MTERMVKENGKRSRPSSPTSQSHESADHAVTEPWNRRWRTTINFPDVLPILISIIVPCKNSILFLDECLSSIISQSEYIDPRFVEISIFDDGSDDGSQNLLESWKQRFDMHGFSFCLSGHSESRGCGFARNRAISQSKGKYLCFLDSDDIMLPERCAAQLTACWEQVMFLYSCSARRAFKHAHPRTFISCPWQ